MNWKRIFLFDLGRLKPGHVPNPNPPEPFHWMKRSPGLSAPAACFNDPGYRPGLYYHYLTGMSWRGPRYFLSGRWRRNLLYTTEQLAAMARANAPFHTGLEMLAREEQRMGPALLSALQRRLGLSIVVSGLIFILLLLMGFWLDIFSQMDELALSYVVASCCGALLPLPLVLGYGGVREALYLRMRDRLAAGHSLSETMRHFSRFFPKFYADLVEAGELSGDMAGALQQLGEVTLQRVSMGHALRPVFRYLMTVAAIQAFFFTFIVVKVFPVFVEIVSDVGGGLPLPLRWIQQLPEWTLSKELTGLLILAGMVLFGLLWMRRRQRFSIRPGGALLLAIPGLRSIMAQQNLIAAGTILEKLLRAGVPLEQALQKAGEAEIHFLYRRLFLGIRRKILQGESLADALEAAPRALVPRLFLGWCALGERSGLLPEALDRLCELYQSNVEKRLRIASESFLPVGVLALGCVSLFCGLALFLTLTTLVDAMILY